ncbi:MAG: hypothetical protein CVV18_01625 [Gammaproteobacteria bacterium HGW-Gammaproteobacteria-8]|nr:MAG: hypothetical protein CVV18_01625 [Gammaproteobacteria bacterium HGW-Gammaproteobacteria-8]
MSREILVADATDVETLFDEMAADMAASLDPSAVLVGILRRGVPIAAALADRLQARTGQRPETCELALKRYGEKLELLHDHPHLDPGSLTMDVSGRRLIMVDDVLYTGESAMRAAGFLRQAGARRIELAVLARRCGLTMPIQARYIGLSLDVRPDWVIHCEIPPFENELGIRILHRDAVLSSG